jgi:uncharacterized protein
MRGGQARYAKPQLLFHRFIHAGEDYLFDARSFALFRVNKCALAILNQFDHSSRNQIVRALAGRFSSALVRDTLREIHTLIETGRLTLYDPDTFEVPGLHRLVLLLTERCNLACKYCFEAGTVDHKDGGRMPAAVASAAIDYLMLYAEQKECTIEFYGGEPLLNPETLAYALQYATQKAKECGKRVNFYCISNGTTVTKQIARLLRQYDVTVQVSVDGCKQMHDSVRIGKTGRGSYDRIEASLKTLREEGVKVCLYATVASHNYKLGTVMEDLNRFGFEASFWIAASDRSEVALSSAQWEQLHAEHERLLNQRRDRAPEKKSRDDSDRVGKIAHRIRSGHRTYFGCGGGLSEFTIGIGGEIFGCERLLHGSRGNIADALAKQVEPHLLWPGFMPDVDRRRVCKVCWAKYLCGGGCMHSARVLTDSDDPPEMHCAIMRREAEAAIRDVLEESHTDGRSDQQSFEDCNHCRTCCTGGSQIT